MNYATVNPRNKSGLNLQRLLFCRALQAGLDATEAAEAVKMKSQIKLKTYEDLGAFYLKDNDVRRYLEKGDLPKVPAKAPYCYLDVLDDFPEDKFDLQVIEGIRVGLKMKKCLFCHLIVAGYHPTNAASIALMGNGPGSWQSTGWKLMREGTTQLYIQHLRRRELGDLF